MLVGAAERVVGVDVPDDHQRRVVGNVVAAIVAVQIVARHRLQVRQPADRRMTVWMRLECRGRDLLIEQDVRIVLAALQLGNDDRSLGLAVVRMVQAAGHALGLDEQHPIERVARRGLEVCRLIDPRVAVPAPAELLDDPFHLIARDVLGALEVHVLDPVRHAGLARPLVPRADLVPAPHRGQRRGVLFAHQHLQAVVERRCTHQVHYKIVGYPCPSGRTPSICRGPTSR